MKKKIVTWGGMMFLLAPLVAGVWKETAPSKTLSKEEKLKMASEYDKAVLKNPDFLGEPLRYTQTRKVEARKDLARNEEILAASNSKPPANLEAKKIAWLEQAIKRDKANIDRPGQGTVQQILTLQALKNQSEKDLAMHEARLSALEVRAREPSTQERISSLFNKLTGKA